MENTRPNIESLKKADRKEKTLVISLLLISMAVAFFAFSRNNNISASTPAISNESANTSNTSETETSMEKETATSSDQVPQTENSDKEGVLAVGLFSTMENANKVIEDLDSLGFSGIAKTRGDGKIVVGVPTNEDEMDLMNSVKETYSDAVYIKN